VIHYCNDSQLPALSTEESIDLFHTIQGLHPGGRLSTGYTPGYCPPGRGGGEERGQGGGTDGSAPWGGDEGPVESVNLESMYYFFTPRDCAPTEVEGAVT